MSLNHTPITEELADYIRRVTLREPEVLRRLREEAEGHPDGSMLQIGPEQGQFLHLLARILGARKTLEVGVFMGLQLHLGGAGPAARRKGCGVRLQRGVRGPRPAHVARGRRRGQDRIAARRRRSKPWTRWLPKDRRARSIWPSSTRIRGTTRITTSGRSSCCAPAG